MDYEQEIDLKDLLFVLLYRWRILLLAAVIGAALLGGYKVVKGNTQQTDLPQTESYQEELDNYERGKLAIETSIENLENSMDEQNQYLAEAPLMQINPYKEAFSSADILVEISDITDRGMGSLLKAYEYGLENGDYIQKIAEMKDSQERYVRETIRVSNSLGTYENSEAGFVFAMQDAAAARGILHIEVIGADSEYTEQVLKAVLNQAEELHGRFAAELKAHVIRLLGQSNGEQVDKDLLDQQQSVRNNIAILQKSEKDLKTSLDGLEKPVAENAVAGSSQGLAKYVILGFLAGGFVSVCVIAGMYIMGDKVTSDKEIVNRFRIKSLGAFSVVPEKRVFAALPQTQIVCERNLVECASARRKLAEAEGVILVEERGNSKYSVIAQEIELAKNVNIDVIGVIVA